MASFSSPTLQRLVHQDVSAVQRTVDQVFSLRLASDDLLRLLSTSDSVPRQKQNAQLKVRFFKIHESTISKLKQRYIVYDWSIQKLPLQSIDYRCEYGPFPVFASCGTIQNSDSLSSSESGV
jgi:hypothetical protein